MKHKPLDLRLIAAKLALRTDEALIATCVCVPALVAEVKALREAVRSLIYPSAPSADDLMILALTGGITGEQQEKFRLMVEKVRVAQDTALALLPEEPTP